MSQSKYDSQKKRPPREWLEARRSLSQERIAREAGVSKTAVRDWFKFYSIVRDNLPPGRNRTRAAVTHTIRRFYRQGQPNATELRQRLSAERFTKMLKTWGMEEEGR